MNEMKPSVLMKRAMASVLTLGIVTGIIFYTNEFQKDEIVYSNQLYDAKIYKGELVNNVLVEENKEEPKEEKQEESKEEVKEETSKETVEEAKEPERNEVYEGMTIEELTDKLNRTLSSDLSGMGSSFANYSIELGVDPYLAVAIAMHETGCTWNCSSLMKQCNNVGGQKGEGCGAYKAYDSLDAGIYGFISNIKVNYVDYGLTTAEAMNPKYAEDPTWSSKVNNYIEKIRNN